MQPFFRAACRVVWIFAMVVVGSAQAATAWDESVIGDLSDDRLAPTALSFTAGLNTVAGTTGGGGASTDRDYFTFSVPIGYVLAGVIVNPSTSVSGSSSFFAIESGTQVTATPTGQNVQALLGFGHYGNDAVGTDLLEAFLASPRPVLGAGPYSVWVQETGGVVPYSFDFVLSAVPDVPGAWALGIGLLLVAGRRRRAASTPEQSTVRTNRGW